VSIFVGPDCCFQRQANILAVDRNRDVGKVEDGVEDDVEDDVGDDVGDRVEEFDSGVEG
jgi:hypothetical protein